MIMAISLVIVVSISFVVSVKHFPTSYTET